MFSQQEIQNMPVSFKAADIAKMLGMSKSYVYKLIDNGNLPYYEIGGRKVVLRDDFIRWLASKRRG